MARKNLLKGLMEAPLETRSAAAPAGPTQGKPAARGAVGAVSQSLAALKARAVEEIDPQLIEAGGMIDRLEHAEDDHARLTASLRDYGQQVPVLVRPHPEIQGRYQIVYGRRRVLAARELGIPIKAMIRDLDDQDLVLAQGQENTARRDLSFIEKAHFARQMEEAGYPRKIIADALSIDKTQISRMLSIVARVPRAALYAIGSAPAIGRDRWLMLADLCTAAGRSPEEAAALATGATSDARFEALARALNRPEDRTPPKPGGGKPAARRTGLSAADGTPLGHCKTGPGTVTLTLNTGDGFADWLVDNLGTLHGEWKNQR